MKLKEIYETTKKIITKNKFFNKIFSKTHLSKNKQPTIRKITTKNESPPPLPLKIHLSNSKK